MGGFQQQDAFCGHPFAYESLKVDDLPAFLLAGDSNSDPLPQVITFVLRGPRSEALSGKRVVDANYTAPVILLTPVEARWIRAISKFQLPSNNIAL